MRESAANRYIQHGVSKVKEGDKMSRMTQHDLGVITRAMSNAILYGNYSTATLEELFRLPSTQQLNILSFGPQSSNNELVKTLLNHNQRIQYEDRMNLPEGERSKTSTSIDSFPSDGSVEAAETSLVNIRLVHHLQCDLTINEPLVTQTLASLRDIIVDELSWIKTNIDRMPWLGTVFLVKAQNILSGFASLSEDYNLVEALTKQLSNDILRHSITNKVRERIMNIITIPHSFATEIARAKGNNSVLPELTFRPSFAEEMQAPTYTSTNVDTLAHGGKRPVSASAEKQEETRSTTNRTSRPRPSAVVKKTKVQMGLLYLHDPGMQPQQIFPQGKITFRNKSSVPCVGFCCQGKMCERTPTNCRFLHINNYDGLGQEYFDKLCAHLDENKHGWLSDGMIQKSNHIKLKPQFEHLRGDENGPYTSRNEG